MIGGFNPNSKTRAEKRKERREKRRRDRNMAMATDKAFDERQSGDSEFGDSSFKLSLIHI